MNINPEQLYTYKSLFSVRRVQTTSGFKDKIKQDIKAEVIVLANNDGI